MGLGSEGASNQVRPGKASWDGAKERHPQWSVALRDESESVDANSHAYYISFSGQY